MAVPYTFAGATSAIPLSQLDTNFATTFTLGNTAIQLGNTVTTLNNMTLANVTISSGNVTITNVSVTTANVTTGNITTLTSTNATITNMSSGNVTITGGTINGTTLGATTASSANVTTLTTSSTVTLNGGTANGVAYLNGSKVLTTGSALTFDGTNFGVSGNNAAHTTYLTLTNSSTAGYGPKLDFNIGYAGGYTSSELQAGATGTSGGYLNIYAKADGGALRQAQFIGDTYTGWFVGGSEQMRLTSTGLGIGTSSPSNKLDVSGAGSTVAQVTNTNSTGNTVASLRMKSGSNYFGFYTSNTQNILSIYDYQAGADRVVLDGSGNLGLGVTPSSTIWSGDETRLVVKGNGSSKAGVLGLQSQGTTNATTAFFVAEDLRAGASLGTTTNSFLALYTNDTERARISSDGTFRVKGAGTAGSTDAVQFAGSAPASALLLDSSGNLGLGGTPTYRLDVFGTGPAFRIKTAAATTGFIVDQNNSDSLVSLINYENAALRFGTNATERARIPSAGGFVVGTAALATNATTGFLYVPTCAGTPTGTPATQTGTAPIVVDTTNNKLYFYSGGQWRDAGP